MKIQGQTLDQTFTRAVSLPRPDGSEWTFQLSPLSLGFHRRLHERGIVPPAPPSRVARDSHGQPVKDRQGLAVLISDESDPGFLSEKERHQQHLAVLMIYESLRHDASVEFASHPPEIGSWREFADRLSEELETAGWTLGDVGFLCDAICRLSNLLDRHLEEQSQVFSSPAPASGTETRPTLRLHDPSNI